MVLFERRTLPKSGQPEPEDQQTERPTAPVGDLPNRSNLEPADVRSRELRDDQKKGQIEVDSTVQRTGAVERQGWPRCVPHVQVSRDHVQHHVRPGKGGVGRSHPVQRSLHSAGGSAIGASNFYDVLFGMPVSHATR